MIRRRTRSLATASLALAIATLAFPQEPKSAPSHDHAAMERRGDEGMGFSQAKTVHHFLLKRDGGVIEVTTKDPADTESRDQIRMHLAHIARAFAQGDFDIPMFVHDQAPPGADVMAANGDVISYRFEPEEHGGRVAIATKDPEALAAIHDFLRFQIREHRTGDPLEAP